MTKNIKVHKKEAKERLRIVFNGQSISAGFAIGKVFTYKDILSRNLLTYGIEEQEIKKELGRIKDAIKHALKDLDVLISTVRSDISKNHLDIFQAHKEMLQDEQLIRDLEAELKRDLINAEQIVKNVFIKWAYKFRASENKIIKTKADDLEDLGRRVIRILLGYEKNVLEKLPPDSIVVAKRLLPSDTINMKTESVRGIIVESGSKYSHSAILARALGIPALTNLDKSIDSINKMDEIIVDGEREIAIAHPNAEDKNEYKEKIKDKKKEDAIISARSKSPAVTLKGKKITINANASSQEEFRMAVMNGCDDIGLFRIEGLYLSSKRLPDEGYLIKNCQKILSEATNKIITIRLLDIGADKNLPYLEMTDDLNPSLGLRGVRLLLKHREILKTQVKAMLKLSKSHKIRMLIPMITLPKEIREVRRTIENCIIELTKEYGATSYDIPIGSMIETPAAVACIKEIVKYSDFLSIGTNDLIQYTMAAGRENVNVSHYYEEGIEILLQYIREVMRVVNKSGIECGICGEIAGDLNWTKRLLQTGVTSLSVSPPLIPKLKEKIRKIDE